MFPRGKICPILTIGHCASDHSNGGMLQNSAARRILSYQVIPSSQFLIREWTRPSNLLSRPPPQSRSGCRKSDKFIVAEFYVSVRLDVCPTDTIVRMVPYMSGWNSCQLYTVSRRKQPQTSTGRIEPSDSLMYVSLTWMFALMEIDNEQCILIEYSYA